MGNQKNNRFVAKILALLNIKLLIVYSNALDTEGVLIFIFIFPFTFLKNYVFMKKLFLFLLILGLCSQCENAKPKTCGVVTQKVTFPPDSKSDAQSVSVSYNPCEYIVIIPESKDSFEVKKYVEDNKWVLKERSLNNPFILLYDGTVSGDTKPRPPPTPLPITGDPVFRNVIVLNSEGKPITLFQKFTKPYFKEKITK